MLAKGKVLVSGGAGFVGREVVKQLIFNGYQVTVLDKAEKPHDFTHVKYIKGDIQNAAKCVMATAGQDFVIHLAARPRIPQSFIDPDSYYDDNVTGTRNMLTAASAVGIRKFVYASSSSIYGKIQHTKRRVCLEGNGEDSWKVSILEAVEINPAKLCWKAVCPKTTA